MAKYKLTNHAVLDLNEIWKYTFLNWSEKQADNYYSMLLKSCQMLADNPNIWKKYQAVKNGLFGIHVNKHIIFYRIIDKNIVEITRILYERMDIENRIEG